MKHRILVVGTGSIGERHLRCMLATGRAEVGICEINDLLRKEVTDKYRLKDSYAFLKEALQQPWNAAIVATPASCHIPLGIQLAEAGLHLLIEKPLSTSMDRITELREIIERQELVVRVEYDWHVHPGLREMRDEIVSGRFGKPVQIVIVSGGHFPTARPAYREIYYADRAKGGGAIQDALTHNLNIGEWLAGPIDRIAVDASHMVLEGVQVEDTVHAMTRQGSVMGCYCLNQYQSPAEMTITVVCTEGTVRFEMQGKRWMWMTEPNGDWHDQPFVLANVDAWFSLVENTFLDALEGKPDLLCTFEEGLQTLKVNLAALRSADSAGIWQTT